ncbi:DUF742 domain-containing protein [Solwaraspora sp. WMMB335]|uniref:DUF742 domain-containing protein n=1 Tax=Solwaraspora sp. WMMB335 TaxID=3404118 RepID=UPI003B93B9EF
MDGDPAGPRHDWLDSAAGPVVRPYAVTGGRVRPSSAAFDLLAFVVAGLPENADGQAYLQPEHRRIIGLAQQPVSVADLAADLDLALGVVRVLLGDLLAAGLIALYEPPASANHPHDDILKAVVNGLRAL